MDEPLPKIVSLSDDDLRLAQEAGFDVRPYVSDNLLTRQGYRQITDEDRAVSWGDVGRSVAIGAAGIGQSVGALTEYATRGAVGGDTRKFFGDVAQDQLERMGPRSRRALTSEFFADEGKQSILDDFTASLGLKVASAIPSTVASIIPAGLAVRALGAASVGTRVAVAGATARGTNSVLTGGEVAQQIYSAIDNMSDADLQSASDLYAGYRSMMSEQEARSQYMRDVAGAAPVVGMAVGALAPGVETTLARRLGGEAAKGVIKGAGRGAVTEAAQEFVEGVSGETLSQSALVEARLKSGMDWEKVLAQGLEGALIGAPMGAGGGALGGIGKREQGAGANVPVIPPTGADPAQSAALNATLPPQGEAPAATDPGAVSQTPKGIGTGVQPKPPENVAVGNPQSAPERSATRYPKGQEQELTGEVTVPETLDSLRDQQAKLVSGNIPAMLFPWTRKPEKGVRGRTQEFDLPDGFARVMTREGAVHFDPKTFKRQDILAAVNNGRINEILGYVQSKEDVLAAEAAGDGPIRAIVERGPNGEERGSALVSPSQEGAQVEAFRQRQSPDSTIVREDPNQTVARRMESRPVSPEQEYYDAFDEFRAERAAGSQPFEASPENVAYDVELPEQSVLTPEQNEELWFINEDRPVGQKMTPEEFLARGQTPPPAAPEGRRGADVVEKSKRRATEKAAKRDETTKKQAGKQAKQPTKATTAPQDGDLGPLFTAPVNTEAAADEKPRGLTRLEARMIEKRAREEAEKAEQPSKGKNRTKAEKAALETQDSFGREVAKREPSEDEFYFGPEQDDLLRRSRAEPSAFVQSKVQLRALERRLQSIIDDAKAAGINTEDRTKGNPTGLQKKVFPNTPDGVMYLRVVKDMLGLLKQRRTSDKITQALNQFIVEEHAARQGDFSLMRERRQVEGNERNSRARADVEAPTGAVPSGMTVASPEEQLEQAENAAKRELAMQELDRQRAALERGEIKEIDEEKIRQIGGVEKKGEAKPAVFEKPKKATAPKKDTAEGKAEPPKAKSLKGGSLELSEEELARIVTRADARASQPNLADAEMARDRTAKKGDAASEWLKANDPTYKPGRNDPLFMAGTSQDFKTGQPFTAKARELLLKSKRLSSAQRTALEADLTNEALRESQYNRWDMASLMEDEIDSGDRFFSVGGQTYIRTVVSDGNGGRVYSAPGQVLETRSLSEVMQNLVRDDVADGPLFQLTQLILERNAADVPVHFISNEDMRAIRPNAEGFYDPVANHIVLPESYRLWADMVPQDIADFFGVEASNVEQFVFNHTVLHEGVHAALRNQLQFDPIAVGQLNAISRELLAAMRRTDPNYGKKYLFANAQEFLAEALSNGARQRDMRSVNITRGLAKALSLPVDRNISLWRALVLKAADWLGLGANLKSDIDALDAVLSVVQRIDNGGLAPAGFPVLPPGWSKYFAPGGVLLDDRQALSSDYADLLASGPNSLGPDFLLTRESITDRGKAFGSRMSRVAVKGTTLDQFRQLYRGVFQDSKGDALERVVEGIQRMAPYAGEKRKRAEELAQRFIDFSRNSPLKAAELSEVAIDATMSNVRLGPGADSKHLSKGWRGWQGKARLNALQARYNALGEDGRALYDDMSSFYRDMQNEMTAGLIDNILNETGVNPPDRQAFIARVMNGNMSEADKALLADKPTVLKGLQDATELRVVKGDYFPLMRQGDYVVVTNDKIPDLMGGKEVEPGKVEFRGASRKEAMDAAKAFAEAMANNADRPLRVINLRQTPDDATSTDFGVVVTVQTKGVFYFDTEAEAIQWRRENADAFDVVEPVQDRLQTAGVSADLTTAQFNSLMASIDRQEGTSDETKALMKGIMEQAAARMMAGNRVQQRSISRRNVLGASKDFGRNLVQYGQASGGYLAKIKYMPTVREGLKSMSDLRDNGPAEMKPQRTRLLNEIRARIDQGIIEPNDPPRWLSDLMTLTYLGKLFSPMYSVINGMQPWMVTYPVLAGRYGAVRASRMLGDAYTALGFTDAVTGGIRNTFQAGKQFTAAGLLDTTDVVGSIKKKLAQQSDGADLTKLIDMALERGAMSAGGFEMAQALADGRGAWGTNLSRVDRIARQMPQAVEDVNRAVTLVAAYRLARSAQLTHEKAMARAFDTVMNTQGDYSVTNAPRFFSNPYLRPALQFKKYAQMMTFLMSDMVYRSFKGASPEERRVAQKQLASVLAVQIAMAGALSLPGLEIAKLGFMLAAALGFGDGWDDQEEKLRKLADETFGKALGQMITSGFITRLPTAFGGSGIDLSQRLSLADMWTFGEPRKYDKDNLNAYLAQMLFGAPGSTAADFFDGIRNVGKGEVLKGIGQMLPIKFVADSFKAANNYSEGKATTTEVGMNVFGVRSGRQAEKGREVASAMRERAELQDRYKRLSDRYLKSRNAGERAVIRAQIVEHNKTAPLRYKVFPGALDKVRERIDAERVN